MSTHFSLSLLPPSKPWPSIAQRTVVDSSRSLASVLNLLQLILHATSKVVFKTQIMTLPYSKSSFVFPLHLEWNPDFILQPSRPYMIPDPAHLSDFISHHFASHPNPTPVLQLYSLFQSSNKPGSFLPVTLAVAPFVQDIWDTLPLPLYKAGSLFQL